MWSNFHTHSDFCDGKSFLAEIVASAAYRKMISLGFSSHAPLPFSSPWCMKNEKLKEYILKINQLKKETSRVQIYAGLEVDYIPNKISPNDFKNELDYTIGSIHFVDSFSDGKGWEIDGPHHFFQEGYEKIFKKAIQTVIHRYFELTREMILKSCPTIIGHLDKIKIQNKFYPYFDESEKWYRQEVIKTLDLIKDSGAIVEVNTRGLYQNKSETPYPSPWVLELMHQNNIRITLSSDAHHPDDLVNRFAETARLLQTIGFKRISVLLDGKWQPIEFDHEGVKL